MLPNYGRYLPTSVQGCERLIQRVWSLIMRGCSATSGISLRPQRLCRRARQRPSRCSERSFCSDASPMAPFSRTRTSAHTAACRCGTAHSMAVICSAAITAGRSPPRTVHAPKSRRLPNRIRPTQGGSASAPSRARRFRATYGFLYPLGEVLPIRSHPYQRYLDSKGSPRRSQRQCDFRQTPTLLLTGSVTPLTRRSFIRHVGGNPNPD